MNDEFKKRIKKDIKKFKKEIKIAKRNFDIEELKNKIFEEKWKLRIKTVENSNPIIQTYIESLDGLNYEKESEENYYKLKKLKKDLKKLCLNFETYKKENNIDEDYDFDYLK
jgi:hypothetical protein